MANTKTILQKSKLIGGDEKFIGSSVHSGKLYHDLPYFDATRRLASHRKGTNVRVNFLSNMVKSKKYKKGIDIGCANGGMTFGLQLQGISMTGVEQDKYVVDFNREVEEAYKTGARFICESSNYEFLLGLKEKYDFAILFSSWQWMAKIYGIDNATLCLSILSRMVDSLYMEMGLTAGEDHPVLEKAGIKDEKAFPKHVIGNTFFTEQVHHHRINDGWFPRSLYTFSKPVLTKKTKNSILDFSNPSKVSKTLAEDGVFNKYIQEFLKSNQMAASLFEDSRHFPEIKIKDGNVIEMDDMGVNLTKGNLPSDWKKQIEEIVNEMGKHNLVHRDIHGQNILVKDGVIGLCDFDNMCKKEVANTYGMVPGLGGYNPKGKGFDDRHSLNMAIRKILDD